MTRNSKYHKNDTEFGEPYQLVFWQTPAKIFSIRWYVDWRKTENYQKKRYLLMEQLSYMEKENAKARIKNIWNCLNAS